MKGAHLFTAVMTLLLLLPLVSADLQVLIEPAQQTIKLNESAAFTLTISHNSQKTEYFEMYSPDVQWDISTNPVSDRTLQVGKGEVKTTQLLVRPLYVGPGFYSVPLIIKMAGTNQIIQKDLGIGVARETFGEYMPAIRPSIQMLEKVSPLDEITIKIRLENQNRRHIEKLDLKIRSNLVNKDYNTALKPLESKEVEFKVRLDPATPPQEDQLKVSVFTDVGNRTARFDLPVKRYTVLPYGKVEQTKTISKGWLSTKITIHLVNNGNVARDELIESETNLLARWFSSSNEEFGVAKTDSGRYLTFSTHIGAMEEKTIIVTINYWPIFWTVLLACIAYGLYYLLRSPLLVKKGAMVIQSKDGEVSELKVFVTIRNRSRNSIHDLVLLDMVPPFASVKQEFEVGTLSPEKIVRHEKKGTQLKWTVDVLEPHEERILSYKVHTKISILGGFTLPPAQARYKFFNYERIAHSTVQNLFNR